MPIFSPENAITPRSGVVLRGVMQEVMKARYCALFHDKDRAVHVFAYAAAYAAKEQFLDTA